MPVTHKTSTVKDPRYQALVRELVAQRKRAGLNQADIAGILGLSQPDISKVERFERRLDALEFIDWLGAVKMRLDQAVDKVQT